MAWDVHIHVCFECIEPGVVQRVAKSITTKGRMLTPEAEQFIRATGEGACHYPGPKGDLILWGMVGNYTVVPAFVECLRPFWEALWSTRDALHSFNRIIVFEEQEQSERAKAYVISMEYDVPRPTVEDEGRLLITVHQLPFSWGQY